MNKTFAIGIPTLNRADFLNEVLKKYAVDFPNTHIVIVDNGDQDISPIAPRSTVLRGIKENTDGHEEKYNMGVAKSWNHICMEAFSWNHGCRIGVENILFLNDDIYLGRTEQQVLDLIERHKDDDFIVGEKDWCAFVLPMKTFLKTGEFDENFWPAYFEDGDYHYRMQLLGMSYITSTVLTPIVYHRSMTREKDPSLDLCTEKNKKYFCDKWGGMPGKEYYDYPFNDKHEKRNAGTADPG